MTTFHPCATGGVGTRPCGRSDRLEAYLLIFLLPVYRSWTRQILPQQQTNQWPVTKAWSAAFEICWRFGNTRLFWTNCRFTYSSMLRKFMTSWGLSLFQYAVRVSAGQKWRFSGSCWRVLTFLTAVDDYWPSDKVLTMCRKQKRSPLISYAPSLPWGGMGLLLMVDPRRCSCNTRKAQPCHANV